MQCRFDEIQFHDIDQFRAHFRTAEIEPVQLSRGRLNLGFASLAFEDIVVTRIDCNRKVSDRFHMDPDWLLLVILLTQQQWDQLEAPPGSLVVIAPGTEYRNSVPDGFCCVEVAVRLDLADELDLGHLGQLKGAESILPITSATTQGAENQVNRILGVCATNGTTMIGEKLGEFLRESCLDLLRFLRDESNSITRGGVMVVSAAEKHLYTLAEKALHLIETTPAEQLPSVDSLATTLNTSRRTLLSAFHESLGTSVSRYMLAMRLNGAQRDLLCGKSQTVTDAALDHGFEHFGRFSYHYRVLFGETPSTTLLRGRLFRENALD